MRHLRFQYCMKLRFESPVREHVFALRCVPHTDSVQRMENVSRFVYPADRLTEVKDGFGNWKLTGCARGPHSEFAYEVKGEAFVDHAAVQPEELHGMYRYPTELTGYDASIEEFLKRYPLPEADAYKKAQYLMHALYAYMSYVPGTTDIRTTAGEALRQKKGVCQDYAQILAALCRRSGIPARYVTGLMIGEGFSHAWTEIYDRDRWLGLDPTNDLLVDDLYLKLAHGRDYRDCIVDRGVFCGNARQEQSIYVNVEEI